MESASSKTLESVIRELARLDSELAQHHRFVTILFADIVDSTRFFDENGDVAGLVMVQRCLDMLTPIVERHKGVVVKTIGDALMVRFGRPDSAVRCAVGMQRALAARNADWPQAEQIHIRVAVHLGLALLKENDVIGDVVNVTARIENITEPDTISISPSVYEQIRHLSDLSIRQKATGIAIKGKSERMDLYEVAWDPAENSARRLPQVDQLAVPETEQRSSERPRLRLPALQRLLPRLDIRRMDWMPMLAWCSMLRRRTVQHVQRVSEYITAGVQSNSGWALIAVFVLATYLSFGVALPTLHRSAVSRAAARPAPVAAVTEPPASMATAPAHSFGALRRNISLALHSPHLRIARRHRAESAISANQPVASSAAVGAAVPPPPSILASEAAASAAQQAQSGQVSKDQLAMGSDGAHLIAPPPAESAPPQPAATTTTAASQPTAGGLSFDATVRVHHRHKMFKQCTGVLKLSPERVVFTSDFPEHSFDVAAGAVTEFSSTGDGEIHMKVEGRSYTFTKANDAAPAAGDDSSKTTPPSP